MVDTTEPQGWRLKAGSQGLHLGGPGVNEDQGDHLALVFACDLGTAEGLSALGLATLREALAGRAEVAAFVRLRHALRQAEQDYADAERALAGAKTDPAARSAIGTAGGLVADLRRRAEEARGTAEGFLRAHVPDLARQLATGAEVRAEALREELEERAGPVVAELAKVLHLLAYFHARRDAILAAARTLLDKLAPEEVGQAGTSEGERR